MDDYTKTLLVDEYSGVLTSLTYWVVSSTNPSSTNRGFEHSPGPLAEQLQNLGASQVAISEIHGLRSARWSSSISGSEVAWKDRMLKA